MLKTILIFFLASFHSCQQKESPVRDAKIPDTIQQITTTFDKAEYHKYRDGRFLDKIILGNFDLDTKIDTAFLWVPMDPNKEYQMFGCMPCKSEISFSNHITSLIRESDIGGKLENVGDLDGDHIDEIAYDAGWFMGCWSFLELYKVKDKKWQDAGKIEYYACDNDLPLKAHIKNLGNGKVKLLGNHPTYAEKTECIFDLKADSLPCLVSEKKFDE